MPTLNRPIQALRLLAFAAAASPGFGAAYVGSAYEGFDYTSGAQITNAMAGGTGWNASGDSGSANTTTWATGPAAGGTQRTVNATGLDYVAAGYPAETGLAGFVNGGSSVGRLIGQTVDSGTFYFSFLTQKTVNEVRTVNFSFFSEISPGTFSERLAVGQIANNTNLRNPDGSVDTTSTPNSGAFVGFVSNPQNGTGTGGVYSAAAPIAYDLGTTHLLVGKIEFDFSGGFADRFTLYVDPTADESLVTPYLQIASVDFGSLAAFRMFAGGNQTGFPLSAAIFDEIRFGTTYAGVTGAIPEPSTCAGFAGAFGLLLAAGLRRRRQA